MASHDSDSIAEIHLDTRFRVDGAALHVGARTELVRAFEIATAKPVLLWRTSLARPDIALESTLCRRALAWLREPEATGLSVREIGRFRGRICVICEWIDGQTLARLLATRSTLDTPRLIQLGRAAISDRQLRLREERMSALDPRDVLMQEDGRSYFFGLPDAGASTTANGIAREPAGWLRHSERERKNREAIAVGEIATLLVHACGSHLTEMPDWLRKLFQAASGDDRRIRTMDDLSRALNEARAPAPPVVPNDTNSDSTTDDSESSSLSGEGPVFPSRSLESRYVLEGTAQRGGMSELQRAFDLETRKTVAIKRLRAQRRGNPRAEHRFRREARSMAALDHPNVLRIVDMGRDQAGDYMVCEWADGGSLYDRVTTSGPLDRNAALEIVRKIGSALEHAHARGQIHRDVKPHNILLMSDGEPKLADFGLVLSASEPEVHVPGARPGTPNYMAPEQGARGGDVDERADLYAFAKTILFLFTGKKPDPKAAKLAPFEFRAPLARALSDRPEERHASIREFQSDIERRRALLRSAQFVGFVAIPLSITLSLALQFGRVDEREVVAASESSSAVVESIASPTPVDPEPKRPSVTDPLAELRAQLAEIRARIGDPKVALMAIGDLHPETDADPRTARALSEHQKARDAEAAAAKLQAANDLAGAEKLLEDALARYVIVEKLLSELGND